MGSIRSRGKPDGGDRARLENSGRRMTRCRLRMADCSQGVLQCTEDRLDTSVAAIVVPLVLASGPDTQAAYPKMSPTIGVEQVAETGIDRLVVDSFL